MCTLLATAWNSVWGSSNKNYVCACTRFGIHRGALASACTDEENYAACTTSWHGKCKGERFSMPTTSWKVKWIHCRWPLTNRMLMIGSHPARLRVLLQATPREKANICAKLYRYILSWSFFTLAEICFPNSQILKQVGHGHFTKKKKNLKKLHTQRLFHTVWSIDWDS